MGNFDRLPFYLLEGLRAEDLNVQATRLRTQTMNLLKYGRAHSIQPGGDGYIGTTAPVGFLGSSFAVVPTSGMNVAVSPGLALLSAVAGAEANILGANYPYFNDDAQRLLEMSQALTVEVDAAPAPGNSRIDIIQVAHKRVVTNETRSVYNTASRSFSDLSINKNVAQDAYTNSERVVSPANGTAALVYKVGVAAATGAEVAPAVDTGYVKVAEVRVVGGLVSLTPKEVVDFRNVLFPGGVAKGSTTVSVWNNDLGTAEALVSYAMPTGVRLAVASDHTQAGVGLADGCLFVAHGPGVSCDVTAYARHTRAAGCDVTMNTAVVGSLDSSAAEQLNGTAANWSTAYNHNLAVGQYGTFVEWRITKGAAFTLNPEFVVNVNLGRVS